MKQRIGTLYIRRLKPSDKANDLNTAIRMGVYKYGIFQHGFNGYCCAAGRSKHDLKKSFLFGWKLAKKAGRRSYLKSIGKLKGDKMNQKQEALPPL